MLSNYKPASEWSMVNRMAADGPVHVTPELFQLLAACVEYWAATAQPGSRRLGFGAEN